MAAAEARRVSRVETDGFDGARDWQWPGEKMDWRCVAFSGRSSLVSPDSWVGGGEGAELYRRVLEYRIGFSDSLEYICG